MQYFKLYKESLIYKINESLITFVLYTIFYLFIVKRLYTGGHLNYLCYLSFKTFRIRKYFILIFVTYYGLF